jgi:hypothetical protein
MHATFASPLGRPAGGRWVPLVLAAVLAGASAACVAPAATPAPSAAPASPAVARPSPAAPVATVALPSPSAAAPTASAVSGTPGGPTTAEAAAALVIAADARFTGIRPLDPNVIGQSSWYTVRQGLVGWIVTITIGWGDCQAGCISRHTWTYTVDPSGAVTLSGETGPPPSG